MYERPAVWGRIFIFMMVASVICFATIPWYASLNSDIILLYNIITVLLVGVYSFIAYFKYQFKPAAYFLFAFIAPIIVACLIVVDYVGIIAVPSLNLFAGFSFLIQSFILSIGVVSRYQKVNEDLLRSTLKRLQKEHEAKLIKLRNTELVTQNEIIENQKAQLAEQANVLEEMNLTKDKLLTVLAHDLRAPVNNLKAILSLLSNRLMTADEFYGVSAKLRTDVEHVNQMLEEVLQWVKSQHGGIVPRQVEFDLKDQLEGIVKLFLPVANSKNIFMKVEGAPSLKVMADQDHIHIILRNLLSNAIKFSPTGGTVTLKILEDESVARVIITDAGIGMPQEMIENITSGKRILSTRGTQGEKGTGLGLLLCREFIQLNGGEFFIESKEEEGSAVSFTLPKISGS
jgi:signal transduction histidine kinase